MAGSALDDITGEIVDAAYRLHSNLGPGLLESVYETVLARDLERRGLRAARQVSVSFEYDGLNFEDAYRVDLMVERCVIVEIKSLERQHPDHAKRVLTYLRLLKLPVGLLINFGTATFKEGVQRVVNGLAPSAPPREPNLSTCGARKHPERTNGPLTIYHKFLSFGLKFL